MVFLRQLKRFIYHFPRVVRGQVLNGGRWEFPGHDLYAPTCFVRMIIVIDIVLQAVAGVVRSPVPTVSGFKPGGMGITWKFLDKRLLNWQGRGISPYRHLLSA